ncbi:MAG: hypothetical protein PHO46_00600 [Thermoguttaceae bacterium]|nr:hypothetical protein [Thermoguttaceae bacterium]
MTTRSQETFVLGLDEAGYGPNLGPLVVGASCWRIASDEDCGAEFLPSSETCASADVKPVKKSKKKRPEPTGPTLFDVEPIPKPVTNCDLDFTQRLIERMNEALAPISAQKGIFPLVDSKKLYAASKSLAALERSFWLAAALVEPNSLESASFRSVLANVARESNALVPPPWEEEFDLPLPVDPKTGSPEKLRETLREINAHLQAERIALVDLAARRAQPSEFNALLDRLGLKSDLIANVTLSLVVEMIARVVQTTQEPTFIVLCDKLGGRDRYAPVLSESFPNAQTRVLKESRDASVYRLIACKGKNRNGAEIAFTSPIRLEIRFTRKGESNAPTALASICAKYLRELSMDAFNEFWRRAIDKSLKPTAGYPVDALRFRADVKETREQLGISDALFWRKK